jgi:1-deoxy-D-xylulose-5-phosphate reductoisomerase
VISRLQDHFEVSALTAKGTKPKLLAEQIARFHVPCVAVETSSAARILEACLEQLNVRGTHILVGEQASAQVASCGADVVLNGINGSVGLQPSIEALKSGSQLALANKESVVAGGHLLFDAQIRPEQINPVDSEHSAIWQSLRSGSRHEVAKLILTASGGPFRTWRREGMSGITPEQALHHPTWQMGPVVTINSSNMMNKGLEIIEASRLFGISSKNIEVTVHPQSIVHSLVEFCDGATIAQMSPPDMKLPIALGLSAPDRLPHVAEPCDWSQSSQWTFEAVNNEAFPAVALAREALETSENHTIALNAANEQAVKAFLGHRLSYLGIVDVVRATLDRMDTRLKESGACHEVAQILELEQESRRIADALVA